MSRRLQKYVRSKAKRYFVTKGVHNSDGGFLQEITLDERRIHVDGEQLTALRFADDVALITSTVRGYGNTT